MVKSLLSVALGLGMVPATLVSYRYLGSAEAGPLPLRPMVTDASGPSPMLVPVVTSPPPVAAEGPADALGVPAPAPAPSPLEAAVDAALVPLLPSPVIHTNPDIGFVGLPLWLWLDSWRAVTVDVAGTGITATATPTTVTWSSDAGNVVSCAGPGTPYQLAVPPEAQATDCSLVFTTSSAGMPPPPGRTDADAGSFVLRATVHWRVDWSSPVGAGTGVVPLESSSSAYRRVEQVESVESVS